MNDTSKSVLLGVLVTVSTILLGLVPLCGRTEQARKSSSALRRQ